MEIPALGQPAACWRVFGHPPGGRNTPLAHDKKERYSMKVDPRIPATIVALRTRAVARRGFLLCALFSLAIVPSAWSANADRKPLPAIPMAVFDTINISSETPPPGFDVSFEGVFTSIIGTKVVTGTSRMDVKFVTTDIVECIFTWVSSVGTLVVKSVCVLSDGHGTWHIVDGTGRYKNFKGIGTQTFGALSPGGPFTDFERFAGIATDDKHGDKQ